MALNFPGVNVRSIISGFGDVYVALTVAQAFTSAMNNLLTELVIDFILVGAWDDLARGDYVLASTDFHSTGTPGF